VAQFHRILWQLLLVPAPLTGDLPDGKGYYCQACCSWTDPSAIRNLLDTSCRLCKANLFETTLIAARQYVETTSSEEPFSWEKSTISIAHQRHLPTVLLQDRFLVQQLLALQFLISVPIVSVDAAASVVSDPNDLMTPDEFRDRMRHRTSLAYLYRRAHGAGHTPRVQFENVEESEKRQEREWARLTAKSKVLPPWLQPQLAASSMTTREDRGDGATPGTPAPTHHTPSERPHWLQNVGMAQWVIRHALEEYGDVPIRRLH
jgi:hypothetical protein